MRLFQKFILILSIGLMFVSQIGRANADEFAALLGDKPEFLPVDQAFIFDFNQHESGIQLRWTIADGYYLYADKFQIIADGATVGEISQPPATQIEDEFFGITDVYFFEANIDVALSNVTDGSLLKVRYQGCAKAGLCYNPVTKEAPLSVISSSEAPTEGSAASVSSQNQLADALSNQSLLWTLVIFFALGVGLAATPCVFPMFPILAGIIAGQKNLTTKKGLWLAFIYVQGMALTYSALGLVVASMGSQFQAYLQHPAILIAVSVLFVLLAGAMFGWYNLQLPSKWTARLTEVSNEQKSGAVTGVFMMGVLSGLIASPCTTAPLTGALLYVAQTGDLFIGFITLYVLSLGMGLPLLLIGASGGKLLPKAGAWMDVVKVFFGFILLFVPLILLERLIDFDYVLMIGGVLLLAFVTYLHFVYLSFDNNKVKSVVWLVKMSLFVLAVGVLAKPWLPTISAQQQTVSHGEFIQVTTLAELNKQIAEAKEIGKPVMFDLYADWCIACKEFEKYTFSDASVKAELNRFHMVQVDMTKTSDADIELMEAFDVLGLPTILFFDENGLELELQRVTGFMDAAEFHSHLQSIK